VVATAVLHNISAGAKFGLGINDRCGDRLHMRQIAHGHGVLERQLPTGAHRFSRPAKSKGLHVESKNHVGTNAADHLSHVVIQAAHHRRDTNHDCNPNHNPEYRQR